MEISTGFYVTLSYTVTVCLYLQRKSLLKLNVTILQLVIINVLTAALGDQSPFAVYLAVFLVLLHYWNLPSPWTQVLKKAVLITGCDCGIGYHLAVHLDKLGFRVYAGCLNKDGQEAETLRKRCSKQLLTLQLDVTNDHQIQKAYDSMKDELCNQGLWAIVNNAGICYIGNIEMMTIEDIQKIVSVNYLGPVLVCKYFLPLLRKSQGRLINISSNTGLAPVSMMGVYCASKSALATMSEVWRYELSEWGIKVSTIIPSGYKTGLLAYNKKMTAERWWKAASDEVKTNFGEESFNVSFKYKFYENKVNEDLIHLMNCITDSLLSESPRSFYYSGVLSRLLPFLYLHSPSVIGDLFMNILGNWFVFKPKKSLR